MQSQRNLLFIGLLLVSFLLWQQWDADQNPAPIATNQTNSLSGDVPPSSSDLPSDATTTNTAQSERITLRSDVLTLTVDLVGGDIVESGLLQYPAEQGAKDPFILLTQQPDHNYVAQSGLIGKNGPDATARPRYTTTATTFELAEGADSLTVPLTYTQDGVTYTKNIVLHRNSYAVNVNYHIANQSNQAIQVQPYGQLKQHTTLPEGQESSRMMASAYRGAAYSTPDDGYVKYKFDEIEDNDLNKTTPAGWVAMIQHYFVTAWIGSPTQNNTLYSKALPNDQVIIGYKGEAQEIAAGATAELTSQLWIGPKLQKDMGAVAPHLDLTVDYGWLWFIAQPLHWLLLTFQGVLVNWGFAIIALTLLVRGLMYPLTKAQYTSMAKMRQLQPKLAALKDKFGDDAQGKQKMSEAMMKLYRDEKVNPLGGCLPILVQMPIFIALYWTLMESVELRHAPFILWIQDLSVKDPFFVLPILMGVSMWLLQKNSPTTVTDPMQQKVMQFMPIVFTFMFLWFPAGLTLYWLVSNVVSLLQQTVIYKQLERKGLH